MRMTAAVVLALTIAAATQAAHAAEPEKNTPPAPANPEAKPAMPAPHAEALAPLPNWPEKALSTTTTEGGVVIDEYKVGTGNELKVGAALVAHYRGTLKESGTKFDASYDRNAPLAAPLWGLIKGWREGLVGMKAGGMRKVTIPYALAYGENGRGKIPPKADLVFEVELIDALVMDDLVVGTGEEVKPGATVTCHYLGTLKSDGSKFDSSYDRNEPATFGLGQVIQGWQFGLPFMKVGGKRKLTIPWQMAYGERGAPGAIPPKADLVFEIEVVSVQNPPAPPPAAPAAK